MGLNIYQSADPGTAFSTEQTFTEALSLSADGVVGAIVARRLYIRNDNAARYFTDVTLQPIVLSGDDIVTGALEGFSWKLIAGDSQPLEDQWALVSPGSSITLSDVGAFGSGDTTTFLPFWLRIEIPRGAPVQSYQNVALRISADENVA